MPNLLRKLRRGFDKAVNEVSHAVLGRGYNYSSHKKNIKYTRLANGYAVSTICFTAKFNSGPGPLDANYRAFPYETAIIDPKGDMHVFKRAGSRDAAMRLHTRACKLASTRGRVKTSWSRHE